MNAARVIGALWVAALLGGCATTIRVEGPGEADVSATIPAGAKDFTYLGRKTDRFVYGLPRDLENQKLVVLVKTDQGAWKYTVFTDRDVVLRYPPKGPAGVGIGAIEAVLPEAPAPPARTPEKARKAAAAAPPSIPAKPGSEPPPDLAPERPRRPDLEEEPSATITPD